MTHRAPLIRRRWLAAGLFASLALNAFLIGAAATDFLHTPALLTDRGTSLLRYETRWLIGRLPDEAMDVVAAVFDSSRPLVNGHLDTLRQMRSALGELVAAPVPDIGAVNAQLVLIRTELDALLTDTQSMTTGALLALPAETRAVLDDLPAAATN